MLQGGCSIIGKPRQICVVAFAFETVSICVLKIFAPFSVQSRPWRCQGQVLRVARAKTLDVIIEFSLSFRLNLRVGEPKRCTTRNLLNFSLYFRLDLRVGEPKRYTTRNLLKLSLSFRLNLRVGEPKRCTTRNY